MDEVEIARTLENHDQHIKSLERRMNNQEEKMNVLTDLTLSVQKLALGMDTMAEKQDDMNARLQEIEKKPAQNWNTMTRTIFTTVVSAIAGGLAVWIVTGLAAYMR